MSESFLVTSDSHGCFDELIQLLQKAGWRITTGFRNWDEVDWFHRRGYKVLCIENEEWAVKPPAKYPREKVVHLGDMNDRGPYSSKVLEFFMEMSDPAIDLAKCIVGNHDSKLLRGLKGNKIRLTEGIVETLRQVEERAKDPENKDFEPFKERLIEWLESLEHKIEAEYFIGVHAAYIPRTNKKTEKQLALYGKPHEASGKTEEGYPRRSINWMEIYQGEKPVVFGHTVHEKVTPYTTANSYALGIDTGGCFGGSLSAVRFEEKNKHGMLFTIYTVPCPVYKARSRPYTGPEWVSEELNLTLSAKDMYRQVEVEAGKISLKDLFKKVGINPWQSLTQETDSESSTP